MSQTDLASNIVLILAFLFVKLTLLLLYLQLFWPLRWLRISVYISATIVVLYYLSVALVRVILSVPRGGESWLQHLLALDGSGLHINATSFTAVSSALNVFLLVLPLKAVASLQLSRPRKMRVIIIFSTGFL